MEMLIYPLSLESRKLSSGFKLILLVFRWGFNLMSNNNNSDDDGNVPTIVFDVLSLSLPHTAIRRSFIR